MPHFREVCVQRFLGNGTPYETDPDRYSIQAGAGCAGMPRYFGKLGIFTVHEGRIYIFAFSGCRADFEHAPGHYLALVAEVAKAGELCIRGR